VTRAFVGLDRAIGGNALTLGVLLMLWGAAVRDLPGISGCRSFCWRPSPS